MGVPVGTVRDIATQQREYAQGVINNVTLQDVAGILEAMHDSREAEKPEIFRQYQFPIDQDLRILDGAIIPTMPWISFTVVNDGPSPVYVFVNEKLNIIDQRVNGARTSNVAPLPKGEIATYDMKDSKIVRIFLQCDEGDLTSIRIYSAGKRHRITTDGI